MSKAEEVECATSSPLPSLFYALAEPGTLEWHCPALLRMYLQTESLESLRQNCHHPQSISLLLEYDHKIIRPPEKPGFPFQPMFDLVFEPLVEYFVEIEIANQW